jgi:osmotically-inducible protein OsmY
VASWQSNPTVSISADRAWCIGAVLAALLVGLSGETVAGSADACASAAVKSLEPIVVTAKPLPEAVPGEVVKTRVQSALHADPCFYDEHVTVTVKNGIVRLQGIVFDVGDIQDARRIIRIKVAGVKRVVNELEICSCNGAGGG